MTEKDIPFTPSLYFAQQNTREVCEMSAMLQGTIRRSGLGSTLFQNKASLDLPAMGSGSPSRLMGEREGKRNQNRAEMKTTTK